MSCAVFSRNAPCIALEDFELLAGEAKRVLYLSGRISEPDGRPAHVEFAGSGRDKCSGRSMSTSKHMKLRPGDDDRDSRLLFNLLQARLDGGSYQP